MAPRKRTSSIQSYFPVSSTPVRRSGRPTNNSQAAEIAKHPAPLSLAPHQHTHTEEMHALPLSTLRTTPIVKVKNARRKKSKPTSAPTPNAPLLTPHSLFFPATPFSTVHTPAKPVKSDTHSHVSCCGHHFDFDSFVLHNAQHHLNAAPSTKMGGLSLINTTVATVLFKTPHPAASALLPPTPADTPVTPALDRATAHLKSISFLYEELEAAEEEIYWTQSPAAFETSSLYATRPVEEPPKDEVSPSWFVIPDVVGECKESVLAPPPMVVEKTPMKGGHLFDFTEFMGNSSSSADHPLGGLWTGEEHGRMLAGVNFDPTYSSGSSVSTVGLMTPAAAGSSGLSRVYDTSSLSSCNGKSDMTKKRGKAAYKPSLKRSAAKEAKAMAVTAAADAFRLSKNMYGDSIEATPAPVRGCVMDFKSVGFDETPGPMAPLDLQRLMVAASVEEKKKPAPKKRSGKQGAPRKRSRKDSYAFLDDDKENCSASSPVASLMSFADSAFTNQTLDTSSRRSSFGGTANDELDEFSPIEANSSLLLSFTEAISSSDLTAVNDTDQLDALLRNTASPFVVGESSDCAEAAAGLSSSSASASHDSEIPLPDSAHSYLDHALEFLPAGMRPPLSTLTDENSCSAEEMMKYMMMMIEATTPVTAEAEGVGAIPLTSEPAAGGSGGHGNMWTDLIKFEEVDEVAITAFAGSAGAGGSGSSSSSLETVRVDAEDELFYISHMLGAGGGGAGDAVAWDDSAAAAAGLCLPGFLEPHAVGGDSTMELFLRTGGKEVSVEGMDTSLLLGRGQGSTMHELEVEEEEEKEEEVEEKFGRVDSGISMEMDQKEGASYSIVGRPPYTCQVAGCGKIYTSRTGYKYHLNVHRKADVKEERRLEKMSV
ncbi:hypothetical protein HDU98_011857 [Podochytrium sp. JEL0797]|nr:hypothetical protein HDU98_011857 [Podochytrium sp. JEL0797]